MNQIEIMQAFLIKSKKSKESKDKSKEEKQSNLSSFNDEKPKIDLISVDVFKGMSFLKEFTEPNMPTILTV